MKQLFGPYFKGQASGYVFSVYKITAQKMASGRFGWAEGAKELAGHITTSNVSSDALCSALFRTLPQFFAEKDWILLESVQALDLPMEEWIVRSVDTLEPLAHLTFDHYEPIPFESPKITKEVLRQLLGDGLSLKEVLPSASGQECEIFKASEFEKGKTILYIPDYCLNNISPSSTSYTAQELNELLNNCYTGDDFIELCRGDEAAAEKLFWFCDWQHPSSALGEDEEEFLGAAENKEE